MHRKIVKSTPFGAVAILWIADGDAPKVVRVLLSRPDSSAVEEATRLHPRARAESCAEIDRIAADVEALLAGEDVAIPLDAADLSRCGDFQRRVLQAEHRIPRGAVSTYRLLAAHLGQPRAARAVGNALGNNPIPLIVPCHRAVRSDRTLGGYQGGLAMKRALLENEGVAFDDAGRVVCERFWYEKP